MNTWSLIFINSVIFISIILSIVHICAVIKFVKAHKDNKEKILDWYPFRVEDKDVEKLYYYILYRQLVMTIPIYNTMTLLETVIVALFKMTFKKKKGI